MILKQRVWTVPAERMKEPNASYVFPSGTPDNPLSNMALLVTLGRMNRGDITSHGFRSTFRDWAAERTEFPNEVVEMALAHAIESKTEAAYRRSDLFEKRRRLIDAWADFCGKRAKRLPPNSASADVPEIVK